MQRVLIFALATIGAFSSAVPAQSRGGPYAITRFVIAGGGATLEGGSFRLSGTLGQPATASLAASGFRLYDGFWAPAAVSEDRIFANGFDP